MAIGHIVMNVAVLDINDCARIDCEEQCPAPISCQVVVERAAIQRDVTIREEANGTAIA